MLRGLSHGIFNVCGNNDEQSKMKEGGHKL